MNPKPFVRFLPLFRPFVRRVFDGADALLFPRRCGHCGEWFTRGLSNILCRACFNAVPRYGDTACWHCGIGLPSGAFEGAERPVCRDCGDGPYALDVCHAFGPYEGALRLAHHAFKFEGMEHLSGALGRCLSSRLSPVDGYECLVPVPIRPERERERGYHPSFLLAGEVSKRTGRPVGNVLEKTKVTKAQVELDKEHRLRNLKDAFEYVGPLPPPRGVMLVDDVYTTGGTLEACAIALKRAGIEWVGAVVLGRTPHHGRG